MGWPAQLCATFYIQVPTRDTIWPLMNSRKLRWRSARNVCGTRVVLSSGTGAGASTSPVGICGDPILFQNNGNRRISVQYLVMLRPRRVALHIQENSFGGRQALYGGISRQRHFQDQQAEAKKDEGAPIGAEESAPRLAQVALESPNSS